MSRHTIGPKVQWRGHVAELNDAIYFVTMVTLLSVPVNLRDLP
jgi:hypothetical protein